MKLKRFYYVLMAPGLKRKVFVANQPISCDDLFGKPVIDSVYYSSLKYVLAPNETVAEAEMRSKLKGKWIGFRRVHAKQ